MWIKLWVMLIKTQSNGNRSKARGSFGYKECCSNVSRETLPGRSCVKDDDLKESK
jgi:hypothetical protein